MEVFNQCEPTIDLIDGHASFDHTEVTRVFNCHHLLLFRKPGRRREEPPYHIYIHSHDAQYLAHKVLAVTQSCAQALRDIDQLPLPAAFEQLKSLVNYWSTENSVAERIHFAYTDLDPYAPLGLK